MNCDRCARTVEDDASFCRFCGARVGAPGTSAQRERGLTRIPEHGQIAGVCAGIAAYLDVDPTIVRAVWVILSIVPGAIIGGVLVYAAAWLLVPEASGGVRAYEGKRLVRSSTDRKIGGVCGGIAEYFGADATIVRLLVVILSIYPGAVVLGVLAYALAWLIVPAAPPRPLHTAPSAA